MNHIIRHLSMCVCLFAFFSFSIATSWGESLSEKYNSQNAFRNAESLAYAFRPPDIKFSNSQGEDGYIFCTDAMIRHRIETESKEKGGIKDINAAAEGLRILFKDESNMVLSNGVQCLVLKNK